MIGPSSLQSAQHPRIGGAPEKAGRRGLPAKAGLRAGSRDQSNRASAGQHCPARDRAAAVRHLVRCCARSVQIAMKPAAMNGAMRAFTASKSLDWQSPPESLSIRPVRPSVSISAPVTK